MINEANFRAKTGCTNRCGLSFYKDKTGRDGAVHLGKRYTINGRSKEENSLNWLIATLRKLHDD